MFKSKTRILALALACTALLSACVTPANLSTAGVAAYREAIELSGRLTVNYQKDGQTETLTGKFSWNQAPDSVNVSLASPLGQTIATIKVTPDSATLTQGDHAPRVARDIDTLTAQTLGWSLPVSGLRDWLQGYATGADGQRFAASPAANTVTTADGWRLTFVSWQDPNAAKPVPKRIDVARAASATAEAMEIRIVIDQQG
ncbi:outer membrane lipoprotein LolB [Massilia antarctica]|uniref:outer membrane lipoprotein LolB n=1 Tax=Massilia antarctica TaxID=2765360 RepID=UPI0006BB92A2|nr:outer membrane lipoprotein LolB [Massilia sp. H27-R4]MCY0911688.1 outer membrane lipoprotein LolB [Massilia sp. H27-R4]CUI06862.1 Outer membrane lipoprotein LolB precursor [Janthinobacterium sp. CG23_2]CUU30648.1 Outer membrane lipoprotein LolB precursor [Janthinobacterium sp. CG23_2]